MQGEDATRRAHLVLSLRSMGITDHAILSAFETTPRELFAPGLYAGDAYADRLIPIACGQTMEAPSTLARLLALARLNRQGVALEIGTGSGYLSALMAALARRVISLERFRTLADSARHAVSSHKAPNVDVILADGQLGWPSGAPYQVIIVTSSVEAPLAPWLAQLAPGGRLILPVGTAQMPQTWMAIHKDEAGDLDQQVIGPAFTTPLLGGLARSL